MFLFSEEVWWNLCLWEFSILEQGFGSDEGLERDGVILLFDILEFYFDVLG